jgi:hypothetical protein
MIKFYTFFKVIFLLSLISSTSHAQWNWFDGIVRHNSQPYQGASVYLEIMLYDGTKLKTNPVTSGSNGYYFVDLTGFNWNPPDWYYRKVIAEFPNAPCPSYDLLSQTFTNPNISYNFYNQTITGNGTVSGTIYVNGFSCTISYKSESL